MHQPPATFEVEGTAIRTKRMKAGKTVAWLAKQTGCTDSYVRKIETGARKHMGPEFYGRLRDALLATDEELLRPIRAD